MGIEITAQIDITLVTWLLGFVIQRPEQKRKNKMNRADVNDERPSINLVARPWK